MRVNTKASAHQVYSLEPAVAVLTLIPNPSSITHTRSVHAFPGQTAFVAGFSRRRVCGQHEAQERTKQQVCVHALQPEPGHSDLSEATQLSPQPLPPIHLCGIITRPFSEALQIVSISGVRLHQQDISFKHISVEKKPSLPSNAVAKKKSWLSRKSFIIKESH